MKYSKIIIFFIPFIIATIWFGYRYYKYKLDEELFVAASSNNVAYAEKLIKKGANVNAKHHFGRKDIQTPLLIAILEGNPEMVSFLIDHGASIDRIESWRFSPLEFSTKIAEGKYSLSSSHSGTPWAVVRKKQREIIPILVKATQAKTKYFLVNK
jgi:hypothetical protein